MADLTLIRDLVLVLIAAFFGGAVAKKLRLPLLVGYLMSGMFVGSVVSRFISLNDAIKNIAEIGVALLLFTLGLEFTLQKLKKLGEVIILCSTIQILLVTFISAAILPLFGMNFYTALYLGAAFSLSSTVVVVKTLQEKGELDTIHGEIAAGWLFMQDVYTLPLLIILPSIGQMGKVGNLGIESIWILIRSVFFAFISLMLIVYLGKKAIPYLIERIANLGSRELVLIASVSICLAFAFVFSRFGFSGAVGAFIAGILLASSSAHHGIFAEVRPLRDLFSTVFFVSLGFILSPSFLISNWLTILILAVTIILLKLVISFVLVLLLGYHSKTATLIGFSLVSVGEFAFILALIGVGSQLITQEAYMIIIWVSFITLIVSIPLISAGNKIYYQMKDFIKQRIPPLANILAHLDKRSFMEEEDLSDHVVVLGYGRVGKYICRALEFVEIPYIVVDYDHHVVKMLREKGAKVVYGDPAEIDVLKFAKVKQAKAIILAYADRHMQEMVVTNSLNLNPSIKLIARIHFEEDQKKLKSLGVEAVVQPEFEAAVSITEKLLRLFNVSKEEIDGKITRLKIEHGI